MVLVLGLLIAGCTENIKDIKNTEHVGKTVTVYGTVKNSIKLGPLSGFSLVDSQNDSISVSSDALPAEGDRVTVRGTLIKDTLFGYYIKAEKIV